MSWSYDESTINTTTAIGRLNAVRLLVGDTDSTNQIMQDEEINFSIAEANNNVYYAASHVASLISSKYSGYVTTELDGALRVEYNELADKYKTLAGELWSKAKRFSGTSMGVFFGGTTKSGVEAVRADTNRIGGVFTEDQFRYPQGEYNKQDFDD